MKIIALALAITAAPALAQVPVTVTTNIPGAAWHIEDIAKFSAQLEQMKLQVLQLQQTYQSLNGVSGIARLFELSGLRGALPTEWQGIYNEVAGGGYSGISGSVRSIIAAEKAGLSGSTLMAQTSIINRAIQKAATDKAMGQAAYAAATQRLSNLQALTRQIDASASPKQVMDLQARIATEQASIQNEQTKLQLMSMLQRNEAALIEQQKDQISSRVFNPGNQGVPRLPGE